MDGLTNIGVTIGKTAIVAELRRRGKKQINLDSNKTGKDDSGGRALLAIADAVDTIDITDNPKALRNIGKAMIAAGNTLIESAEEIEES